MRIQTPETERKGAALPATLETAFSVRSPETQKCYPLLPTVKSSKDLENNFEAIVFYF